MENKDLVFIQLDRPRELRYGHKALKTLLALTGKDIDALELDAIDPGELEKYIYCGLLADARANGEDLKLEDMEDLLDAAPSYTHIIQSMQDAINASFGGLSDPGNLPAPEAEKLAGAGEKA